MHEYLVEDILVLAVLALLDRLLGTRLLQRKPFLLLLLALNLATVLADGYLTARPVLLYDPRALTLPRLWHLPLEDLGYGTALIIGAVMTWELLGDGRERRG